MIERFLQYIKYEKGYSSHTFVSYRTDLYQFKEFVESRYGEFVPEGIESSQVREWVVSMMEAKESASSVNRKLSALKSFYRFMKGHGYVEHNPMRQVVAPKREKRLPKFLREGEMDQLLSGGDQIFGEGYEAVRDELIIEMFYTLGVRLSELINIKDADVDMSARTVRVTGKRNKQRLIPFGEPLKRSIESYWQVRDAALPQREEYLLLKSDGGKLYPVLVYRIVNKYLTMVSSLSKRSPHVLRHTFATAMLNNGAELNAVKELLGHAKLSATEVYTHTTFEQIRKIYKQAHPRA